MPTDQETRLSLSLSFCRVASDYYPRIVTLHLQAIEAYGIIARMNVIAKQLCNLHRDIIHSILIALHEKTRI